MYSFMVTGYGTEASSSIQSFTLDPTHYTLTTHPQASVTNPSFSCTYQNFFFTITEEDGQATVWMYQLQDNELTLLDHMKINEIGELCHISYSPQHHTLFGACYQTGHIFSILVQNNKFSELKSLIRLEPDSSDGISRAHCVQMDTHFNYLYAVNIRTDKVYCFKVIDGKLIPNEAFPSLSVAPGSGPRHITFHPHLSIAYIITEYSNEIFTVSHNPSTGQLTLLQTISTLPADYSKESYCSTCIVLPNGHHLLAANRGHNSICRFRILENGTLSLVDFASCGGDWPRHITCSSDGELLAICNQNSNEVTLADLNKDTGKLGKIIKRISFNNPSYTTTL